jgi:hypothetical protein
MYLLISLRKYHIKVALIYSMLNKSALPQELVDFAWPHNSMENILPTAHVHAYAVRLFIKSIALEQRMFLDYRRCMVNAQTGPAQYLARFSEESISCTQYALGKLGVDRTHCFIKIEEYVIVCVPFQLSFKKALFLTSLSKQELVFFQRYVKGIVGLSIAFNTYARSQSIKFFIHCTLTTVGQMKGRENVGLFVLDLKTTPDELVDIMGNFMDHQDKVKIQYEDYGKISIRLSAETAKKMGYNMYATITEPGKEPRRIQVFNISSKSIDHMEAAGAPQRAAGQTVAYQLYFKKYRVNVPGTIIGALTLPQGIVKTASSLSFCPELVEIIDDYWYNVPIPGIY